jgi:hypothetical protein
MTAGLVPAVMRVHLDYPPEPTPFDEMLHLP